MFRSMEHRFRAIRREMARPARRRVQHGCCRTVSRTQIAKSSSVSLCVAHLILGPFSAVRKLWDPHRQPLRNNQFGVKNGGSAIVQYLQPVFSSFSALLHRFICSRAGGAPQPSSAAGRPSPAAMVVGYALLAVVAGVADRVLVHLAEGLLQCGYDKEMCTSRHSAILIE